MAGTAFEIALNVDGASGVVAAAAAVDRLGSALEIAEASATKAAEAVEAGKAAYKAAEASATKAALAVEKIGIQTDAQRGKLAKAIEIGDAGGVARAEAAIAKLSVRQAEAAQKAAAATTAMHAESAALDQLKAASAAAKTNQESLTKAHTAAKKAFEAARKPMNAGEAAGALGKLGGPLGAIGQKAFDTADAFQKMSSSLGSAGPYAAVAVAVAAIATGVAMVSAAALAGVGAITLWAVKLADTDGMIKKITDRGTAGFKKIFSGLNIKPLLGELGKVAGLFDEGSASARAIKVVFESLFQPIVDGITAFVPKMVAAFIQFEILVLKAMIAIKPFGSTILEVAKYAGALAAVAGGVLAVAIGVVVTSLAVAAVGITVFLGLVGSLILALGAAAWKVVETGAAIISGIGSAIDYLRGLSLAEIGTMLIDGLVAGLQAGAGAVLNAITGIATGAIGAAKSALGIASPSKIFAEIGMNTAAGMSEGVDTGAGEVAGSLEAMVAPPAVTEAAPPAAAPASSGGGNASGGGINVENLIVQAPAGTDPAAWAQALRLALGDLATSVTGGTGGTPSPA